MFFALIVKTLQVVTLYCKGKSMNLEYNCSRLVCLQHAVQLTGCHGNGNYSNYSIKMRLRLNMVNSTCAENKNKE